MTFYEKQARSVLSEKKSCKESYAKEQTTPGAEKEAAAVQEKRTIDDTGRQTTITFGTSV